MEPPSESGIEDRTAGEPEAAVNGLPAAPYEPPVLPESAAVLWEDPQPRQSAKALTRLVSGLEAGVIGGLAMLLLLIAGAMWRGDVWWAPANLLATTFYGRRAFHTGPGMATLSGTAFHIVLTGMVGALFGLACGGVRERRRLVILGTLAGIFWYYFADAVFWRWVNILVPAYAPQPSTLVAHAVYGACLGFMGQNLPREKYRLNLTPALSIHSGLPSTPPPLPPEMEPDPDRVETR